MGWQDAPLVGGDQQKQGWQSAPLVNQGGQAPTPNPSQTSAPASPQSASPPPDQSQGQSWLLSHLARASQGLNDWTRAAQQGMTFGLVDKLLPGVSAQAQADTAAAQARLGTAGMIPEALGYAVGPGEVMGGLRAGAAGLQGLTGLGARALTSIPAEGALASGVGTAAQGGTPSQIATATGIGGALGGVTSLAGNLASRIGPKPVTPDVGQAGTATRPATGMYAQREAAYAPLDKIYMDPGEVQDAINVKAQNVIANQRDPQGMGAKIVPDDTNNYLTKFLNNPAFTARNLQDASRYLRNQGDWVSNRYADALDGVMQTSQPIAGGAPGDAWAAKQAGDLWHGRIQGLERLDAESPSGAPGPTAGAVAKTRGYYDPADPEYQALGDLQSAQQPRFNWWLARHAIGPVAGAAFGGIENAIDPEAHKNPWLNALSRGLEGGLIYGGLHRAAAPSPSGALANARYAIGTGQLAGPRNPIADPVAAALRNLLFGQGASGSY
jgi:hypothetical protein